MSNPLKKQQSSQEKGRNGMEQPPNLLAAILSIDFNAVRVCVEEDASCVNQLDNNLDNAMHYCIYGGTPRMREIMEFLINETDINLLQENKLGRTPIQQAFAINDHEGAELLEQHTLIQLHEKYPDPNLIVPDEPK